MELRLMWKVVRRWWWLIAASALAAFVFATYTYVNTPQSGGFAASIRFTAAQPDGPDIEGGDNSSYYVWLTSEYVVNALTDWVKTGSFARAVSEELATAQHLEIAPAQLQGAFAADNARSILTLTIYWPQADQLAAIADAASAVLSHRSREFFPPLAEGGAIVTALDSPSIAPIPPSLSERLNPLIRFGLGLAAGVGLAFLVHYLDPTLRERAEVEALGLPVLAEVPRHK